MSWNIRRQRRITPAFLIVLAASLAAAGGAAADPASVATKQARAQEVLAQVQEIDAQLGRAIESYNRANVELEGIQTKLKQNRRHLVLARGNLTVARQRLADRLVAIYTAGGDDSTLGVVLGATSLDDMLSRIETANRVSDQDARILGEVIRTRRQIERHRAQLTRARARQQRVVASRAAQRSAIEGQLSQRRALLSSIRSEIAQIRREEARRQRALARQVQARVADAPPEQAQEQEQPVLGAAASTPEGETVAPPARHGGVVGIAMRYLGVPYRWGGASPSTGFDCSGFTMYVYAQVGVSLPHYTGSQWAMGSPVARNQLQPGDLVFFNGLGHMGIYIGGNQMIHAPRTGDVVKISSLTGWYAQTYMGARRL